jgi:hypothetical protein
MYSIMFQTKNGLNKVLTSSSLKSIKRELINCFEQKLEATVRYKGIIIGKTWQDNSQTNGWNWFIVNN